MCLFEAFVQGGVRPNVVFEIDSCTVYNWHELIHILLDLMRLSVFPCLQLEHVGGFGLLTFYL